MTSLFIPVVLPILITSLATIIMVAILYRYADSMGLIAHPGEHRKHLRSTPTIGGIAVYCGLFAGSLFVETNILQVQWLLVATFMVMVVGVLDDVKPMSVSKRFGVQLLAAAIMTQFGDNIIVTLGSLVSDHEITTNTWAVPLTWFAVIGVINAVNMSDGVDGLAASHLLVCLMPIVAFYWWGGTVGDAMIPLLLMVALGIFLWWNYRMPWRNRALIFLGDGGSMWLGMAMAWFLIDITQPPKTIIRPVTALWIFAVPLIDTVSVMLRRVIDGRSPFSPDRTHIHHLFMHYNWPEAWVPLIISTIAAVFISFGLFGEAAQIPDRWLLLGFLIAFFGYFAFSFWLFDIKRFRKKP